MKFFGRDATEGQLVRDEGRFRVEAAVESVRGGFKVTGTVRGRPGAVEICRFRAPDTFLANNWQSWGPIQKMRRGDRFEGLAARMEKQGRFVFSPIPETALERLMSDYFIAWEGGVAGFLASRVGHPYFAVEDDEIAGYVDYFDVDLEDAVPLEPLVVLSTTSVEQAVEEYGIRVALENGVRVSEWNPIGWSSWYHYFTDLTFADVEKNLKLAAGRFPFEVFQVDDGFEADIGDWLNPKAGFGTLPELARLIRGAGFRAGIWTAPFSAAETSDLAGRHPEWMVAEDGKPRACYRGWGKNIYALDATRLEAKRWLSETFAALEDMGYDFFKVDFLFAAAMAGARSRRVTPIQAYREGLAIIREAVGTSFLLGCGAPLLPSVGLVDGMRVGEDTAPFWDSKKPPLEGVNAYYALRNPILRSFMNKKWWLNDPDCLLLRRREVDLSDGERELYARTAGALDTLLVESDDLELVDERGRELLAEAVRLRGGHVRVRGLMNDDAYIIDSWGGPSGIFRFAANLSDASQTIGGRDVPARSGLFIGGRGNRRT
jgi:alpha-galactosidase